MVECSILFYDILKLIFYLSENQYEKDLFEVWQQEDKFFVSTKASEEVEKRIQSENLVMVKGHMGSGKSAIVQHIALKYRAEGWTIKPVDTVEDIKKDYESGHFTEGKTIFVLHDSFGKHVFDENEYQKWEKIETALTLFLRKVKIIVTCRESDFDCSRIRLNRVFEELSVVSIDENDLKLSREEKTRMLKTYFISESYSEENADGILEIDKYFPLLCKLHANRQYKEGKKITLLRKPVDFFKNEIERYRESDKEKYCALACLVFFNNELCLKDLKKKKTCFKDCLRISGITDRTSPKQIIDSLEPLIGSIVRKVHKTYHFFHDLIMEVYSFVFGTNHCKEIIRYADIGFLRTRVRFSKINEPDDSLTIVVGKQNARDLSDRFYEELFLKNVLEVILNPCLRNEDVIKFLIEKLNNNKKKIPCLLRKIETSTGFQLSIDTDENYWHSKFEFLNLIDEISALFALIVFEHNDISILCVKTLLKMNKHLTESNLFFAICINGFPDLFDMFPKDEVNKCLEVKSLKPLITQGMNINLETDFCTPLTLAAIMGCKKDPGENNFVKRLLENGAEANLCLSLIHI